MSNEPLPATDRASATVFLLLLHLAQNGFLFDLDECTSFFLAETKPEFFNPLTLLTCIRTPNFAI